jgi:hypothetical protein
VLIGEERKPRERWIATDRVEMLEFVLLLGKEDG